MKLSFLFNSENPIIHSYLYNTIFVLFSLETIHFINICRITGMQLLTYLKHFIVYCGYDWMQHSLVAILLNKTINHNTNFSTEQKQRFGEEDIL